MRLNRFAKCVNRAIPKQHNNKLMSKNPKSKFSHPSWNAFNTFNVIKRLQFNGYQ